MGISTLSLSELIGKFDVVHLRLVTLVIKNKDPTTIIWNVAQLLSRPIDMMSDPGVFFLLANNQCSQSLVAIFNGMK